MANDFYGGTCNEDGSLLFSINNTDPYPLGVTNVELTVSDRLGTVASTCTASITVTSTAPQCSNGGQNPIIRLIYLLFAWLKNEGGFEKLIDLFTMVLDGKGGGKGGSRCKDRRRHRRAAAGSGQCQLLQTKEVTTVINETTTPENVQTILGQMQDGTSVSVSTLRSLYLSLLSGLDLKDATEDDMEVLVEDASTTIDLNGDGSIDALEMDQVQLPRETGDFLFDNVVACTSSNVQTASGETCVTPDNVVDFVNQFYAGTEVVGATLAREIRDQSGSDAYNTRHEFEAAFGSTTTLSLTQKETLSGTSVAAHQQSTGAWTAAAAGAVLGTTALYVAGT